MKYLRRYIFVLCFLTGIENDSRQFVDTGITKSNNCPAATEQTSCVIVLGPLTLVINLIVMQVSFFVNGNNLSKSESNDDGKSESESNSDSKSESESNDCSGDA